MTQEQGRRIDEHAMLEAVNELSTAVANYWIRREGYEKHRRGATMVKWLADTRESTYHEYKLARDNLKEMHRRWKACMNDLTQRKRL